MAALFSFPATLFVTWYRRVLPLLQRYYPLRFSRGKTTRFDTRVERLFKTAPSRKRNADN